MLEATGGACPLPRSESLLPHFLPPFLSLSRPNPPSLLTHLPPLLTHIHSLTRFFSGRSRRRSGCAPPHSLLSPRLCRSAFLACSPALRVDLACGHTEEGEKDGGQDYSSHSPSSAQSWSISCWTLSLVSHLRQQCPNPQTYR